MSRLAVELPEALVEAIARRTAELLAQRDAGARPAPDPAGQNGRLAFTPRQAAEAIGVSVDHLERHVLPELRIVRSGRLRLIPAAELARWVDQHAARALSGGEHGR